MLVPHLFFISSSLILQKSKHQPSHSFAIYPNQIHGATWIDETHIANNE